MKLWNGEENKYWNFCLSRITITEHRHHNNHCDIIIISIIIFYMLIWVTLLYLKMLHFINIDSKRIRYINIRRRSIILRTVWISAIIKSVKKTLGIQISLKSLIWICITVDAACIYQFISIISFRKLVSHTKAMFEDMMKGIEKKTRWKNMFCGGQTKHWNACL